MNAPQQLREQLRRGTTDQQLDRCARLRTLPSHSVEHRATVRAMRATARRALFLEAEAAEHKTELEQLVMAACPNCSTCPGWVLPPPRNSSSPGATWTGSAARPRSPPSPVSHPSRPAAATRSGTGSTAAATANSTEPCTPSPSPGCSTIKKPGLRRPPHQRGQKQPRHQTGCRPRDH